MPVAQTDIPQRSEGDPTVSTLRALIEGLTGSPEQRRTPDSAPLGTSNEISNLDDIMEVLRLFGSFGGNSDKYPVIQLPDLLANPQAIPSHQGGHTADDCSTSLLIQMIDLLLSNPEGILGFGNISPALPIIEKFKPLAEYGLRMSQGSYCETRMYLMMFAAFYSLERRLGEAETIYQAVLPPLDQREAKLGAFELLAYAVLASNRYFQNRFDEAYEIMEPLLHRFEDYFGEKHHGTLALMGALAEVHARRGQYREAEVLLERQLQLSRRYLKPSHPVICLGQKTIGRMQWRQGRFDEAERLLSDALESETSACRLVYTPGHPWTAWNRYDLGRVYMGKGDYAKADPLLSEALNIAHASLGEHHPTTIEIMQAIAELRALQKKAGEAATMLTRMDRAFLPWLLGEVYWTQSASVRRRVVGSQSRFQEVALLIALQHPNSRPVQDAASSAILRYKGLQGEEEAALARLVRTKAVDTAVRSLAEEVHEKRSALAVLYHAGSTNEVPSQREEINRLTAQLEEAELELSRKSGLFNRQFQERETHLVNVQAALRARRDKAVLVEFRRYGSRALGTPDTGKAPDRWAAVVIDAEKTRTIDLGAAADIDPLIRVISNEASYKTAEEHSDRAALGSGTVCDKNAAVLACVQSALYQSLISPLDISHYQTVFLVPDGALHLVPFHALRRNDGSYWISDASQSVRRLHAGRVLAYTQSPPATRGLVVFGGLDYGAHRPGNNSAEQRDEDSSGTSQKVFEIARRMLQQQGPSDESSTQVMRGVDARGSECPRFAELPASRIEAKLVEKVFRAYSSASSSEPSESALGEKGTESRLKSLPEPPRILHLATHGFYRPATQTPDCRRPHSPDRPMVLSGVALARANAGVGLDGEDGILYAIEAQNLNLDGTQLVVLSACETGQGVIERGEGVYGLVRALRTAGAKNTIVALRKILDEETSKLMEKFYNKWLNSKGQSPAKVLENTKRDLAQQENSLTWASFIAIGDAVTN